MSLCSYPPPPVKSPPLAILGNFDFSSDNGWLCSLVLFLLVPHARIDSFSHSDTNVCHRRSRLVPLSQQGHHGVWGQGHVFDGMYFTSDICKDEQIPKRLKVPVKSKPAKPASKRARNHPEQSASASSSDPQPVPELPTGHVQEFKVGWTCKKFHTVPVERARTQQCHHVSIGLTPPAFCMHCSSRSATVLYHNHIMCPPLPPLGGTVTKKEGGFRGGGYLNNMYLHKQRIQAAAVHGGPSWPGPAPKGGGGALRTPKCGNARYKPIGTSLVLSMRVHNDISWSSFKYLYF